MAVKKKVDKNIEKKQVSKVDTSSTKDDSFAKLFGKVWNDIDHIKDINKESGMEVIPTDLSSLNRIVGIGGINVSGIWLIHGPTHSGKSALAKAIARAFVATSNMVFYYDYEKADKDNKWISALLGTDVDESQYFVKRKPSDFEEGTNEMIKMMRQFKESRDNLKKELKKLKASDDRRREEINELLSKKICFVIDSVAKMVPRDEKEGEIGKKNFGLLAALATQFMRVATSYIGEDDSNITLIMVQHERQNQKAKTQYDPAWILGPGGESINNFDQDVKIRVTSSVEKEDGAEVGKSCKMKVYKCKIGVNGGEGVFFIGNGKGKMPYGFDFERELATEALERDVITKEGSTYYYEGEKLGVGFENVISYLRENEDTYDEIFKTLNNNS